MTVVVKLGGTNGSGKTSVARALISSMYMLPAEHRLLSGKKTLVYSGPEWVVLGSYKNSCGGMDTISDKFDRQQLVRQEIDAGAPVIFFEGLITGKTYGAFGAMSDEPAQKGKWIYAFMDTPFDVCVRRVMRRRMVAAQAKGIPCCASFNAERTMRPTYKSVLATAKRAAAAGHKVVWLCHDLSPSQIADRLVKEVGNYGA